MRKKEDKMVEILFFKGFNYENEKRFEKGNPTFHVSVKRYRDDT